MRIDFVSDIVCPWCAIGLSALEQALERLGPGVAVSLHFQPFELNPDMPPEGQDIGEHLAQKYGLTPEQVAANREMIRQRGEDVGFTFRMDPRSRIVNTFNAHRLLHWAGEQGGDAQHRLKKALLGAYFTEGQNPSDIAVLLSVAGAVGLDESRARQILEGDDYTEAVRERQRFYAEQGIRAVPSVILNNRHLIQGGQPVEVFEQALRQVAAAEG
ncbi:DsbA family oxidoreductase [Caldimonas sp.]|uniref:DsbA family oxidoreductase n=1 Tax=Caldimonas sp. TaxID=2838790 RepID=UPI00391AC6BE